MILHSNRIEGEVASDALVRVGHYFGRDSDNTSYSISVDTSQSGIRIPVVLSQQLTPLGSKLRSYQETANM